MSKEILAQILEEQIIRVCHFQARYRVLWVIGSPNSGKTTICRYVCRNKGWRYIDFTLDRGFLDSLIGNEEIYRPEDFSTFLHLLCSNILEDVIVLDEIEPLLALWNWDQREQFIKLVGYDARLSKGIVIVTRLFTNQELTKLVPGEDHIFEIT